MELILVVWADKLATLNYERAGLDWARLPVEMELVNFVGVDDRGPSYSSTLQHVGTLTPSPAALTPGPREVDGPVAEWARQVRSSPAELQKLARAVDPRSFGSVRRPMDRYHLFAAHFRLDYHLPDGQRVESLRPFGELLTRGGGSDQEYYRIGVRNIRGVSSCGLAQELLEAPISESWGPGSGYVQKEYQLHFRAPRANDVAVPWSRLPVVRVKRWIEEESA